MKSIPVKEAVGLILCHDITEIVPGQYKTTAFRRGHVVRPEDLEHLLRIGKENLYVWSDQPDGQVHEDDAARRIARAIAGPNISYGDPLEGRINLKSDIHGLFVMDLDYLNALNDIPDVSVAAINTLREVQPGQDLAGTRVIPLCVAEESLAGVEALARERGPLMKVLPFIKHRVGVITTGSEVFHGRIQDAFTPVLRRKFEAWGSEIAFHTIVPDQPSDTVSAIRQALAENCTLVAVTGGMSVDPDDKTPAAIREVCGEVVTYGTPVFPGAMFMLGYHRGVPVTGLPGCVMYKRASIFDLIAPRLLAGQRLTRRDFTRLGHGGYCEQCPDCHYPNCSFGRG
ncbi:MAG: molybdopterin-binding protein [Candidatus Adiutrix sp.]|jgi:molybdenum cofactor synthesis domain-containing protein|nr:molybdopterin-binding protein [Candidatus Adiutrix sp.]